MKKMIFITAMLFYCCTSSAQFILSVTYGKFELKTGQSMMETFIVAGSSLRYNLMYIGKTEPGQTNTQTTCDLSKEQLKEIELLLENRRLNVSDSLNIDSKNGSKDLVTINITFAKDKKTSTVSIMADSESLNNKALYKNSIDLIMLIKKMLKDCR